jgi:hypothetical protein
VKKTGSRAAEHGDPKAVDELIDEARAILKSTPPSEEVTPAEPTLAQRKAAVDAALDTAAKRIREAEEQLKDADAAEVLAKDNRERTRRDLVRERDRLRAEATRMQIELQGAEAAARAAEQEQVWRQAQQEQTLDLETWQERRLEAMRPLVERAKVGHAGLVALLKEHRETLDRIADLHPPQGVDVETSNTFLGLTVAADKLLKDLTSYERTYRVGLEAAKNIVPRRGPDGDTEYATVVYELELLSGISGQLQGLSRIRKLSKGIEGSTPALEEMRRRVADFLAQWATFAAGLPTVQPEADVIITLSPPAQSPRKLIEESRRALAASKLEVGPASQTEAEK